MRRCAARLRALVLVLACAGSASRAAAAELEHAEQAFAHGDYADAERELRELAVGEGEGATDSKLALARLLLETGRYAEAADVAAQLETDPATRSDGACTRAEALEAQGKLDDAERAYKSALTSAPTLRARVRLGRLLFARGRAKEAKAALRDVVLAEVPDDAARAENLAYVAMAFRALGQMHEANDTFREAAESDKTRVETQLEWAALFMEKYDDKHAAESVLDALAVNPKSPLAHALMARLSMSQTLDFATAGEALDHALAGNPNLVAAYVTRAGMALRNMEIGEADAALDRALAINPVDLEALSVRAAVRLLVDDRAGFARAKAAVLAQNPRFSRFYAIVAEYAEWEHRYEDLVAMSRAALAIDKRDPVARATLGLNLLRLGEEKEGLAALEQAWKEDRFNVQVFNTLNLYDDEITPHYETFTHGPFRFRLHREERSVLEPYLVPMVERAYEDMRTRYAFTPAGPLAIELYADPHAFSVRTTGLPNVGVQGVCFGKVVTGLSPRGGPFNWGQIVWHELSHVFHLQLSKNHVPRWFTEGLAEYETTIARTEWKREDEYPLWQALRAGTLPPISQFNRAFTHARQPEDLMIAYYASYRVVAFIVERYGFDKVRPMLVGWGEGKATADLVHDVLGVSIDDLDREFRQAMQQRLAHYDAEFHVDFSKYADVDEYQRAVATRPLDADAWAGLAFARVLHDQFDAAESAASHALTLSPKHAIAHFAMARIALEQRKAHKAERCLQGIIDGGRDGYVLRLMLSRAALARKDVDAAQQELEAATRLDPERDDAWKALLEIAQLKDDRALALRVLGQVAALDQHDRPVHEAYALGLLRDERWPELVREGENAMYIAPASPLLHEALGHAYLETGDPKRALIELDRALTLAPKHPEAIERLRDRARTELSAAAAATPPAATPQLAPPPP